MPSGHHRIFKVCLAILQHYVRKGLKYVMKVSLETFFTDILKSREKMDLGFLLYSTVEEWGNFSKKLLKNEVFIQDE